jgi:hypothetical protein
VSQLVSRLVVVSRMVSRLGSCDSTSASRKRCQPVYTPHAPVFQFLAPNHTTSHGSAVQMYTARPLNQAERQVSNR